MELHGSNNPEKCLDMDRWITEEKFKRERLTEKQSEAKLALESFSDEELRQELKRRCKHKNTVLIRKGITGMLGTVICKDCGYEREYNAY